MFLIKDKESDKFVKDYSNNELELTKSNEEALEFDDASDAKLAMSDINFSTINNDTKLDVVEESAKEDMAKSHIEELKQEKESILSEINDIRNFINGYDGEQEDVVGYYEDQIEELENEIKDIDEAIKDEEKELNESNLKIVKEDYAKAKELFDAGRFKEAEAEVNELDINEVLKNLSNDPDKEEFAQFINDCLNGKVQYDESIVESITEENMVQMVAMNFKRITGHSLSDGVKEEDKYEIEGWLMARGFSASDIEDIIYELSNNTQHYLEEDLELAIEPEESDETLVLAEPAEVEITPEVPETDAPSLINNTPYADILNTVIVNRADLDTLESNCPCKESKDLICNAKWTLDDIKNMIIQQYKSINPDMVVPSYDSAKAFVETESVDGLVEPKDILENVKGMLYNLFSKLTGAKEQVPEDIYTRFLQMANDVRLKADGDLSAKIAQLNGTETPLQEALRLRKEAKNAMKLESVDEYGNKIITAEKADELAQTLISKLNKEFENYSFDYRFEGDQLKIYEKDELFDFSSLDEYLEKANSIVSSVFGNDAYIEAEIPQIGVICNIVVQDKELEESKLNESKEKEENKESETTVSSIEEIQKNDSKEIKMSLDEFKKKYKDKIDNSYRSTYGESEKVDKDLYDELAEFLMNGGIVGDLEDKKETSKDPSIEETRKQYQDKLDELNKKLEKLRADESLSPIESAKQERILREEIQRLEEAPAKTATKKPQTKAQLKKKLAKSEKEKEKLKREKEMQDAAQGGQLSKLQQMIKDRRDSFSLRQETGLDKIPETVQKVAKIIKYDPTELQIEIAKGGKEIVAGIGELLNDKLQDFKNKIKDADKEGDTKLRDKLDAQQLDMFETADKLLKMYNLVSKTGPSEKDMKNYPGIYAESLLKENGIESEMDPDDFEFSLSEFDKYFNDEVSQFIADNYLEDEIKTFDKYLQFMLDDNSIMLSDLRDYDIDWIKKMFKESKNYSEEL